jgi:hypothetical protein
MKIDVVYGLVTNALMLYVNATPENKLEKKIKEDVEQELKESIQTVMNSQDQDDDHSYRGLTLDTINKTRINLVIKKLVYDIGVKYDTETSLHIKIIGG